MGNINKMSVVNIEFRWKIIIILALVWLGYRSVIARHFTQLWRWSLVWRHDSFTSGWGIDNRPVAARRQRAFSNESPAKR